MADQPIEIDLFASEHRESSSGDHDRDYDYDRDHDESGSEIVVAGGPRIVPLTIGLVAVTLLAFIGWQALTEPEPSDLAVPDVEQSAPSGQSGTEPGIPSPGILSTVFDPTEIVSKEDGRRWLVEAGSRPTFPLIDDLSDLVVAFTNDAGGVSLLDAATGSVSWVLGSPVPRGGSSGSLSTESVVVESVSRDADGRTPTIGRIADTLVLKDGREVVGYPLDGSGPIVFGDADELVLTEGLVVLINRPAEGNGSSVLSSFLADGTSIGNVVEPAFRPGGLDGTGYRSGPSGSFVFTGESFEKQSDYPIVASGPNHVIEARCAEASACELHRVELGTWRSEPVQIGASFNLENGISPDGQWLSSYSVEPKLTGGVGGELDGVVVYRLIELATGDYFEVSDFPTTSLDGLVPPQWDSTSRFAVLGHSDRLRIIDTEAGEIRSLKTSALGIETSLENLVLLP